MAFSNDKRKKTMNSRTRILKLWLAVLLLVSSSHSLLAAPPFTGIRGQTFIHELGFEFEVSPGKWIGDDDIITYPAPTSFTVFSPRSRRPVGHLTTASDGSFQVSLPPGKYVIIPDSLSGLTAWPRSFAVTVRLRHYADILIYYEPTVIQVRL